MKDNQVKEVLKDLNVEKEPEIYLDNDAIAENLSKLLSQLDEEKRKELLKIILSLQARVNSGEGSFKDTYTEKLNELWYDYIKEDMEKVKKSEPMTIGKYIKKVFTDGATHQELNLAYNKLSVDEDFKLLGFFVSLFFLPLAAWASAESGFKLFFVLYLIAAYILSEPFLKSIYEAYLNDDNDNENKSSSSLSSPSNTEPRSGK